MATITAAVSKTRIGGGDELARRAMGNKGVGSGSIKHTLRRWGMDYFRAISERGALPKGRAHWPRNGASLGGTSISVARAPGSAPPAAFPHREDGDGAARHPYLGFGNTLARNS